MELNFFFFQELKMYLNVTWTQLGCINKSCGVCVHIYGWPGFSLHLSPYTSEDESSVAFTGAWGGGINLKYHKLKIENTY